MTKFQIGLKKLSETQAVAEMHKKENLSFTAISNSLIRNCTNKYNFYTSSQRAGGSEYFLAEIDGKIAFVRISNHWGKFWVRNKTNDDIETKNWTLTGDDVLRKDGLYKMTKQAGFFFLD